MAVAVLSAAQAAAASAGLALALAKVAAAMGTGAEALPLALAQITKTQQRYCRKKTSQEKFTEENGRNFDPSASAPSGMAPAA